MDKPATPPAAPNLPPFIEDPTLRETFADGLHMIGLGAGVITLTFSVTRSEDGKPPKITRAPASRLVLTLPGAIELHQKLGTVLNMLHQQQAAAASAAAAAAKVTQ